VADNPFAAALAEMQGTQAAPNPFVAALADMGKPVGPRLDRRGREYDPRFAPEPGEEQEELAPSSRSALARSFKTQSYEDVQRSIADQKARVGMPEGVSGGPPPGTFTKLESAAMGLGQGATAGFMDEFAAAGGQAISRIPGARWLTEHVAAPKLQDLSPEVRDRIFDPNYSYRERRDDIRGAFARAKADNPASYGAGEIAGGIATAPILPGAGAAGTGVRAAATAAAKAGATYGAIQGLGESTAELTQGDASEFGKAFMDAGRGALSGAATGAVLGGLGAKLVQGAPEREAAEMLRGVRQGEGTHGGSTTTAGKLLDLAEDKAVAYLRRNKDLADAAGKPAKEALPVFEKHLEQVGSKLDPKYATVEKAAGGLSMTSFADAMEAEIQRAAQQPGYEKYIKALQEARASALRAWAPELGEKLAANAKAEAAGLTSPVFKKIEDVHVPLKDFRAWVTRLQKRGTDVIDTLNPGEAAQAKAEIAAYAKSVLDAHLDRAAETGGAKVAKAVDEIRQINKDYSALATMVKNVEQRKWKETSGSTSGGGHLQNLFKHGGALAALPLLLHGNLPAAAAAYLGPRALPYAIRGARAGNAAIARATRSDAQLAQTILRLMQSGMPRAAAISAAQAAQGGGPVDVARGGLETIGGGEVPQ
jgi:hypothetical protein